MAGFEQKLAARLERMDDELRRLARIVSKIDEVLAALVEAATDQQREIEHLRHELHRRYPATTGVHVTPR